MKRKLALVLCILWMGFIFYNSSNDGYISELRSHALLNDIKGKYNEIRDKNRNVSTNYNTVKNVQKQKVTKVKKQVNREEKLNLILRKNAHAFEYLVLSIFVAAVLFSFNFKGKSSIIYIMFICLFYAVTDEFHQMFVPGRSSLVSDVLIDFLGSIIGIGLFYLFYYKIISCIRIRKRM